jgi:NAD(P)-dependent dehydrogenase (short-subunit alcohol dehydrogenase family)
MTAPDVSSRSLADLFSLAGRTALVTGGARGIGESIARRLVEAGAAVAIGDTDVALAEQTAQSLSPEVAAVELDVASPTSVRAAVDAVEQRVGPIDVLVNNAGLLPPPVPAINFDDAQWQEVLAVNVTGVMNCTREVTRRMVERNSSGAVVNIASVAAFRATSPGMIAYTTSKHAVNALTKMFALELGPHGIRVLDIAPSMVETPGMEELRALSTARAAEGGGVVPIGRPEAFARLPLGRAAVPDDVARVVVFAISDLATFMTGSTLAVDAGSLVR